MNSSVLDLQELEELLSYYDFKISPKGKKELLKLNSAKWLRKCTLLLKGDKVLKNYQEIGCGNYFQKNKQASYYVYPSTYFKKNSIVRNEDDLVEGTVVHSACYNFIAKETGHKIKYSDFTKPIEYSNMFTVKGLKYSLSKYQQQDFDFIGAYFDGLKELLKEPNKSQDKKEDIMKNYNKIFK